MTLVYIVFGYFVDAVNLQMRCGGCIDDVELFQLMRMSVFIAVHFDAFLLSDCQSD